MPMLYEALRRLNHKFEEAHIEDFARMAKAFAPGNALDAGLILEKDTKLQKGFQLYLDRLPGSFSETLRSVLYYALTSSPPVPITFAWVPGYDFEISVWEPDCGVTVLLRGPSPD